MRILLIILYTIAGSAAMAQTYSSINSTISFTSTAPLEVIVASSSELNGALDLSSNAFAFKLYIKSFEGFSNPLQQEHFYENYMEVESFPLAYFRGKILEQIQTGKNKYRAKGSLEIHGVEKEIIIDVNLDISENAVFFDSYFEIFLPDYNIEIPRIVEQKIATDILIKAQGELLRRK